MTGPADPVGALFGAIARSAGAPCPVVARLEPENNSGIGVSTVHSYDLGYETALLDAQGAHPVERYDTEEEARAGHEAWVARSRGLRRVVKIGYPGLVEDEEIVLVPYAARG